MANPEHESTYIGLISGDYVMVPQKHTDELASQLPNLDLAQGYLVRKDADKNLPVSKRAETAIPGVTYATMHIAVSALNSQSGLTKSSDSSDSGSGGGSSTKEGKKKKPASGSGSGSGSSSGTGSKPG